MSNVVLVAVQFFCNVHSFKPIFGLNFFVLNSLTLEVTCTFSMFTSHATNENSQLHMHKRLHTVLFYPIGGTSC